MSLILEALKKSEQQRRLGETPTLGSPMLVARKRRNLLPIFAALILVALAAGWWLSRTPTTDESVAPKPEAVAKAPTAPSVHPKPASPAHPREAPPAGTRQPPNANAATATAAPPAANRTVTPTAPAPSKPPLASTPSAQNPPAAASATQTAATPPPPAKPAVNPVASSATPAPAPAATPTKPAPETKPAAPTATTAAPAAPPAKPAPAQPALPSVWELPYATRKDLPELTLTMHLYATEPSERFVVIKGDRHVEGDELGDGVVLKEIRPDGMVLEFKGQRFVYPRDGR